MVDPNRKVPDLYFKVMDPKLQVADLKAKMGELRYGGIPRNLTVVVNKNRFQEKSSNRVRILE